MSRRIGRWVLPVVVAMASSTTDMYASGIGLPRYAQISEAAHKEQWSNVVLLCERATRASTDAMGLVGTNALPLGFLVNYQYGRALMRLGGSATAAYERLQQAAGWLARSDPDYQASNAWCALYATLGQSCRAMSRYYDAQMCIERAMAFTSTESWERVQLQLDLIELDDARGRVAQAEAAIAYLWRTSRYTSRRLAGRYAFHLLSVGKRKEAMRVALDGIAEHGVRAYQYQDDPLLCAALLAQDEHALDEISELYDMLGLQLQTLELNYAGEETCVLLISQRRLLVESYPHLTQARDVEMLRERCTGRAAAAPWTMSKRSEEWHVD